MADEMNQDEQEQFQKWLKNKQARKISSTAKRKAISDIRKKYASEYKALVRKYGGSTRD